MSFRFMLANAILFLQIQGGLVLKRVVNRIHEQSSVGSPQKIGNWKVRFLLMTVNHCLTNKSL